MNEHSRDRRQNEACSSEPASKIKRSYDKPQFQHEKSFETMALACGKLSPHQSQCNFNRKNS
jgi:hypothetical protein